MPAYRDFSGVELFGAFQVKLFPRISCKSLPRKPVDAAVVPLTPSFL